METLQSADSYAADRKPSFVDLDHFARTSRERIADRTDYIESRLDLYVNGKPGPVGVIALDAASGVAPGLAEPEFIHVLEGELFVCGVTLKPGQGAIVASADAFAWQSAAGTLAVYLRYPEGKAEGEAITPIRPDPEFAPSGKPSADVLIGPAPECHSYSDYRLDEGRFVCGTWTSTAYQRHGFEYAHYEIMYLLEGAVTLENDGVARTFRKGDTFLAEAGSHCAWDSRETVTKVYAIYRPS